MRTWLTLLLCALALTGAATAQAQSGPTRYVTDEFRINLRSGAGNQYRILELITTGTGVELLQTEQGWSRVRIPTGQVGWVPSQYLQSEPPAADRLRQATATLEQVRAENQELSASLEQVRASLAEAQQAAEQLRNKRERLDLKLEQAQQGLDLFEENKQLKKQVIDLNRRVQNLVNETERLSDRSQQDWFLVGAGVLFAGMMVGIVVTRVRWRRRSGWGDL